jgi:hypothetical protein
LPDNQAIFQNTLHWQYQPARPAVISFHPEFGGQSLSSLRLNIFPPFTFYNPYTTGARKVLVNQISNFFEKVGSSSGLLNFLVQEKLRERFSAGPLTFSTRNVRNLVKITSLKLLECKRLVIRITNF